MLLRNKTKAQKAKIVTPDSLSSDSDRDLSYEDPRLPVEENNNINLKRKVNRSIESESIGGNKKAKGKTVSVSNVKESPRVPVSIPSTRPPILPNIAPIPPNTLQSSYLPYNFPSTPYMSRLIQDLPTTFRNFRIEGTRHMELQTRSQGIVSAAVLSLPSHAHRSALAISMNRYSAFCAAGNVDFPAFPITANKVAIFLIRSTNVFPIGKYLLDLIPQPSTFPLPIVQQELLFQLSPSPQQQQQQSNLSIEEGNFVTRELATSWTEALAYAQGATRAIWNNFLPNGVQELSLQPIVQELLSAFQTEREITVQARTPISARMVRGRNMAITPPILETSFTSPLEEITANHLASTSSFNPSPPEPQYLLNPAARNNSRSHSLGNPPNFQHDNILHQPRHSIAPASQLNYSYPPFHVGSNPMTPGRALNEFVGRGFQARAGDDERENKLEESSKSRIVPESNERFSNFKEKEEAHSTFEIAETLTKIKSTTTTTASTNSLPHETFFQDFNHLPGAYFSDYQISNPLQPIRDFTPSAQYPSTNFHSIKSEFDSSNFHRTPLERAFLPSPIPQQSLSSKFHTRASSLSKFLNQANQESNSNWNSAFDFTAPLDNRSERFRGDDNILLGKKVDDDESYYEGENQNFEKGLGIDLTGIQTRTEQIRREGSSGRN